MSTTSSEPAAWRNKAALIVLVCYWLVMVVCTHIPRPPIELGGYRDKIVHCAMYAGLAFLISLNWSLRQPLLRKHQWMFVAIIALVGAVDELTQIPVGRSCDIRDWIADMVGTLLGLWLFQKAAARFSSSLELPAT